VLKLNTTSFTLGLEMDRITAYVGVLAITILLSFLLSYPLMLLWNLCLVPAVTIVKEVGWLQMWGIGVLIGVLFKTSVSSRKD